FFTQPALPDISPLPLHDALPISGDRQQLHALGGQLELHPDGVEGDLGVDVVQPGHHVGRGVARAPASQRVVDDLGALDVDVDLQDRKSTRLNSSHVKISYAVFCL